jgi:hypothetical protein
MSVSQKRASRGMEHHALADIANIREALKGYEHGFAFVKEIIQNADDARATEVTIAWHPGLGANSKWHPLLNGPALYMINNATFEERHAEAICRMGLGSKAGEDHAIGKFGLGIKSVFHVCEAFFFLASDPNRASEPMISELLNPWKGSHHREWDNFSKEDVDGIYSVCRSLLPLDRPWFCLWLPLRREAMRSEADGGQVAFIRDAKLGDSDFCPPEIKKMMREELADLFPMLRRLERIRFYADVSGVGQAPTFSVELQPDSARSRFDSERRVASDLLGSAVIQSRDQVEKRATQFIGCEGWLDDSRFADLKNAPTWPRVVLIEPGGADANHPEKALPHHGVYITSRPTVGPGHLRIVWSVFLPVGNEGYYESELPLALDVTVVLHGYFFLDSTRTRIDGLAEGFQAGNTSDQKQLCREWNRRLALQGTLQAVLPTLERFASESKLSVDKVAMLTKQLAASSLIARFKDAVCGGNSWLFALNPDGGTWKCISNLDEIYELPFVRSGELELPLTVLPALHELVSQPQIHFTYSGDEQTGSTFPAIRTRELTGWTEARLLGVLSGVSAESVRDEHQVDYLLRFLASLGHLRGVALKQLPDLPLFAAKSLKTSRVRRYSLAELLSRSAVGTLFSQTSDLRLASSLQKAVAGIEIVVLADDYGVVLKGLVEIQNCTIDICKRQILNSTVLSPAFERTEMLNLFLARGELSNDVLLQRAARYLLHGDWDARQSNRLIFVPQHDPQSFTWLHVTEVALAQLQEPWRLLAECFDLNQSQKNILQVAQISKATCELLLNDAETASVDFSVLEESERQEMLKEFDIELLRHLGIHRLTNAALVAPDDTTYLDKSTQFEGEAALLWLELTSRAKIVARLTDSLLEQKQEAVFQDRILDENAAIRLAATAEQPERYAPVVMAALARIGTPSSEAGQALRNARWVRLSSGVVITPKEIIWVEGADDEISRHLDPQKEGLASILSIDEKIRRHAGFRSLKTQQIPKPGEALGLLSLWVSERPNMCTGLPSIHSVTELKEYLFALDGIADKDLPVYPLLQAVAQSKIDDAAQLCLEIVAAELAGRLDPENYLRVLNWLSRQHENGNQEKRRSVLSTFKRFLGQAWNLHDFKFYRADLRLLNEKEQWKDPSELTCDYIGIDASDLLHHELTTVLFPGGAQAGVELPAWGAAAPHEPSGTADFSEAAQKIIDYLSEFENKVPRPLIGALVSLLGDEPKLLAWCAELLEGRSIEVIRDQLVPPGLVVMGRTVRDVLPACRFVCEIVVGQTFELNSVLGTPFRARLAVEVDSFLLGDGLQPLRHIWVANWNSGPVHRLTLLDSARNGDGSERSFIERFRNTAEQILSRVYCRNTAADLSRVWELLTERSQLGIGIAQKLILNSGDFYIQTLGSPANPDLRANLRRWQEAKQLEAQMDEALGQADRVTRDAARSREEAKAGFKSLLETRPDVQRVLLEAVRKKMRSYQYECRSIPFELFQNADDAYQELGQLMPQDPNPSQPDAQFVVVMAENTLSFGHWGRRINHPASTTNLRIRDLGYDRDLQKMLTLSSSDKDQSHGEVAQVTGKFGLGFKSVFLVSQRPEILSGSLAFEVVAGFYPKHLEKQQQEDLKSDLARWRPGLQAEGTIIRLPIDEEVGVTAWQTLERFIALIAVQLAFSRRIKKCVVIANETIEHSWQASPVFGVPGAFTGVLCLPADAIVYGLMIRHYREETGNAAILFAVSPHGFVRLPASVPSIWITAPTLELLDCGFAINGPFEPNVGRSHLAAEAKENCDIGQELATTFGKSLTKLHELGETNWAALKTSLGLATDMSPQRLWRSLWLIFSKIPASHRKPGVGSAANVLTTVVWGSQSSGYGTLISTHSALPTELLTEEIELTSLDQVELVTSGIIDHEEGVFCQVAQWPHLKSKIDELRVVSESRVQKKLIQFWSAEQVLRWDKCDLPRLLKIVLSDSESVDPHTASMVGSVLTKELLQNLYKKDPQYHRELDELDAILGQLRFRSQAGQFAAASEMVVGQVVNREISQDESIRALFAPPANLLDERYDRHGVELFAICRRQLHADSETLALWALGAAERGQLGAVLNYLLSGDIGVRTTLAQRLQAAWLNSIRESQEWRQELSEIQRRELCLLFQLGVTVDQKLTAPKEEEIEYVSPERVLDWWRRRHDQDSDSLAGGMYSLFFDDAEGRLDAGAICSLVKNPDRADGKLLWYKLLSYCCLRSARVRREGVDHFWREELGPLQFWEKTSEPVAEGSTADHFHSRTSMFFEDVIHRRLRANASGERAELWRRVFYDIRKVHWLVHMNEFPSVFLEVLARHRAATEPIKFLRDGTIFDQPFHHGVMGQSSSSPLFWLMRELRRLSVIQESTYDETCYYVCASVRQAAANLGWVDADVANNYDFDSLLQVSRDIHSVIMNSSVAGEFNRWFDLPLLRLGEMNDYSDL